MGLFSHKRQLKPMATARSRLDSQTSFIAPVAVCVGQRMKANRLVPGHNAIKGVITMSGIDSGILMPEPAHVAVNRRAGAMIGGRATGNLKFNEAKYRAERGGYRRFGPDHSKRQEAPAKLNMPMPVFVRKLWGTRQANRLPNASAPASDMRALKQDWFNSQPPGALGV